MKRLILMLMIALCCFSLAADPIKFEYEPYEEEEFPLWSYELRRAESIFFGSFVITLPVSILCYNLAGQLGAPVSQDPTVSALTTAAIAGGLSLVIAGADYLIGALQK